MAEPTDWRLRGQEKYLKGVELRWQRYRPYREKPEWEHDHCEFCWAKFMIEDHPEVLREGYTTLDEYRWICSACFEDFREMFEWRIVQ